MAASTPQFPGGLLAGVGVPPAFARGRLTAAAVTDAAVGVRVGAAAALRTRRADGDAADAAGGRAAFSDDAGAGDRLFTGAGVWRDRSTTDERAGPRSAATPAVSPGASAHADHAKPMESATPMPSATASPPTRPT